MGQAPCQKFGRSPPRRMGYLAGSHNAVVHVDIHPVTTRQCRKDTLSNLEGGRRGTRGLFFGHAGQPRRFSMPQVFRHGGTESRRKGRLHGFAHGIITHARDEFIGVRVHNCTGTEAYGQTRAPEQDQTCAHSNGCIFRRHYLGIATLPKPGNVLLKSLVAVHSWIGAGRSKFASDAAEINSA